MLTLTMTSNLGESFSEVILPKTFWVFIVFMIGQLIDNFGSQPVIFSKSVKSHPLEIFLVILITGILFGIIGLMIAVPAYTVIKVILKEFLAENKTKPGVVTTASGLQYLVMKEGTGKQPTATSNVTVHYHGTTPDGTVFDSSVDRGQPATFGLNQVIKGWTEGVALMKEGAKYKFFIPQELAYGANPRPGGPIEPFMPLVFEVELIKIN